MRIHKTKGLEGGGRLGGWLGAGGQEGRQSHGGDLVWDEIMYGVDCLCEMGKKTQILIDKHNNRTNIRHSFQMCFGPVNIAVNTDDDFGTYLGHQKIQGGGGDKFT